MKEEMERVNFTLPPAMKEYVENAATGDDQTVSWIMRKAIKCLVENRGDEKILDALIDKWAKVAKRAKKKPAKKRKKRKKKESK